MEFVESGDEVICVWEPKTEFQGWTGIVHGGIQATLLDEVASWVVQVKLKLSGFTSQMNIRYVKPVPTDQGLLTARAKLTETKKRLAFIQVSLENDKGEVLTKGEIIYYVYPEEESKEKFNYPGIEAFFE
jgi:uncharacterized protein (TIGR00369 family)